MNRPANKVKFASENPRIWKGGSPALKRKRGKKEKKEIRE
jgi:hypothetical protein